MPDIYSKKKDEGIKAKVGVVKAHTTEEVRKLAQFCPAPRGVRFETQEAQEELILLMRAHAITNLTWIVVAIAMFVAPFILLSFGALTILPEQFRPVFALFWYLLTSAYSFEQFLNWYFNVYIVTDERIIDVDFVNLLYKRVSEAKLDKIQDVTYSQSGVLRSFFNFGNVFIQTAAEVTEFEFRDVPRPDKVAAVLRALVNQEEQETIEGRIR